MLTRLSSKMVGSGYFETAIVITSMVKYSEDILLMRSVYGNGASVAVKLD